jgi:uncharacterized protein YabE (DUF348 family)
LTNTSDATTGPIDPTGPLAHDGATRPRRRRRWPLVAGATGVALAVTGAGLAYADMHKTVTLDVDGRVQTVGTTASTVDALLEAQGIVTGDRDLVAPGTDTRLSEGADVVVRTGKQITVAVDGEQSDAWVTALDTNEALDSLAARGDDVSIVASRSGDRATLPLDVDTDGPVAVVHDGTTELVHAATDVEAVLAEVDVTLGDEDRVHVADAGAQGIAKGVEKAAAKAAEQAQADTAEAPQVAVVVQRVETKKVTKTSVVEHKTKTKTSDDRYADLEAKVSREGKDGERTRVFRVTTVDGEVVTKKKLSDEVTTKPVAEILVKGTKERPEPEPEPATSGSSSSGSSSGSASSSGSTRDLGRQMAAARGWTGSQWTCLEALWTKESNWNATAQNPSSGAYGIPQSLPGSKMGTAGSDWQTNPATQIEWGLGYIAGRYGTPCGAWSHSQANNWY